MDLACFVKCSCKKYQISQNFSVTFKCFNMAVALNPLVKWAQDRHFVYLTVELSDAIVDNLQIDEESLNFEGMIYT